MSDDVTVFVCNRGGVKLTKVQLELSPETLEKYKAKAAGTKYTAKQLMETMLRNWVDGVEESR